MSALSGMAAMGGGAGRETVRAVFTAARRMGVCSGQAWLQWLTVCTSDSVEHCSGCLLGRHADRSECEGMRPIENLDASRNSLENSAKACRISAKHANRVIFGETKKKKEEVYTRSLPLTSCQEDRLGLDYTVLCHG